MKQWIIAALFCGICAAQTPQIAAGTWRFTINALGPGFPSPLFTALLQIQPSGNGFTGIFLTGSGNSFPGFSGTISPNRFFSDISIKWDSSNRDVPGIANPYTGMLSPDGKFMIGTWRQPAIAAPFLDAPWEATYIPPSAPLVPVTLMNPMVAACTATVQSLTLGSGILDLNSIQCFVTPTDPTGAIVQFVGGPLTATGVFQ